MHARGAIRAGGLLFMTAGGEAVEVEEGARVEGSAATGFDRRVKVGFWLWGLALLGSCEWVAAHEYFKIDDFFFLARVRSAGWSLSQAFLPEFADRYWAVRPLGEPTWFWLANRVFGLHAFAWWQCALAIHAATGLVVFRIARQLRLTNFAAGSAGALAVALPPALVVLWFGVGFAYLASILLSALCVHLFLAALRGHGARALTASCASLAASLLCHESAVSLPLVLAALSQVVEGRPEPARGRGRDALAALPAAGVSLAYLAYRSAITGDRPDLPDYRLNFSPLHVVSSYIDQAALLFGGTLALVLLAAGLLAALVFVARSGDRGRLELRRLLGPGLVCLLWAGLAVGPMVLLPLAHIRFSSQAAVPIALVFGMTVHAVSTVVSRRLAFGFELSVLAIVIALTPWSMLVERARNRNFDFVREAASVLDSTADSTPPGGRIVLVTGRSTRAGGPVLAHGRGRERFQLATYGERGLFGTVLGGRDVGFGRFELGRVPELRILGDDCRYLTLDEDLQLAEAPPDLVVEEILRPALTSGKPHLVPAAATGLLRRDSPPRPVELLQACRPAGGRDAQAACVMSVVEALRAETDPRGEALARRVQSLFASRKSAPGR